MKLKYNPVGYTGFVFTVVLAVFFILHTFGWAFINGSSNYWVAESRDLTQHLSGLNLYLSSPWQFPLLGFDGLNYPQGTRVTFIDGIPIYAFLLKLFLPRNIGYISPFGYWVGLTFLLQGIAAWWITKELKVNSWAFLVFLILTFLTYPAFMDRLRHVALMSHWIILFAVALYLRGNRLRQFPAAGWSILLFCGFYTHIYLFAMALGIYIAAVLEEKNKITLRHCMAVLSPLLILGASLFIFLLPLPSAPKMGGGFDAFAMNLLSPFTGGQLVQLQTNLSHSLRGFNYLGLGVIIIFLWTAFSQPSINWKIFQKHGAFFIIMLGFFLYSLSNKIYFSGKLVAIINYSDFLTPITSQLRCSGRFFWPVGYTITIFSLYMTYRQFTNKRWFTFVACLLLFIQYMDIQRYYDNLKGSRFRPAQVLLDYAALDNALGKQVKYIYLYPTCGGKGSLFFVTTPMMRYVAVRQLKLNSGFIARYSSCRDMVAEIAQSNKAESAYIFSSAAYENINQVYEIIGSANRVTCHHIQFGYVCRFKDET